MKIIYEFTTNDWKKIPIDGLYEIPVVGKSNVGKSTLINFLANQKELSYSSSKPGKTRNISSFNCSNKFRIIDLPGYGYSKVPHKELIRYSKVVNDYLLNSNNIKYVLLLISVTRNISDDDIQIINFLRSKSIKFKICGTKNDKSNQSQRHKFKTESLKFVSGKDLYMISSKEHKKREEFFNWIEK